MPYWLQSAFAGIWPLVWHYGLGVGCMGLAIAFAYFSPVFKKTALWVALAIGVGTACYAWGVKDGEYRVQSKWDAAERATAAKGDRIREQAEESIPAVEPDAVPSRPATPTSRVRNHKLDKYDRD